MHLIFKHKEIYIDHLGIFSDEHGEQLHQEMFQFEKNMKKIKQ